MTERKEAHHHCKGANRREVIAPRALDDIPASACAVAAGEWDSAPFAAKLAEWSRGEPARRRFVTAEWSRALCGVHLRLQRRADVRRANPGLPVKVADRPDACDDPWEMWWGVRV